MIFADAACHYAKKAMDTRPVSGNVVMCGGAAVSLFPMTQTCKTLSTSEAEDVVKL